MTKRLKAYTMPDLIEKRYASRALKIADVVRDIRVSGAVFGVGVSGPGVPV